MPTCPLFSIQRRQLSTALALSFSAPVLPAWAQTATQVPHPPKRPLLPLPPSDRTVLTVEGPKGARQYTLAQLEAFGVHEVETTTFWPDDNGTYHGPRLADVLRDAGLADSPVIRVAALDGFSQRIPQGDWVRWPVLLATRQNGKPMGPRAKGPLRIVYPRDMDPELQQGIYRLRWVWMVNRIDTQQRP
jgi:hypothetical protein